MSALTLTCGICKESETFSGDTDEVVNFKAYYFGWRMKGKRKPMHLCPHHAALFAKVSDRKREQLRRIDE